MHNLAVIDGKEAMFYTGKVPWHGLGEPLPSAVNSETAIRMARLDWQVQKVPLYAPNGDRWIEADEVVGIVRSDLVGTPDLRILGVVSPQYRLFQNKEGFEFFDRIVGGCKAVYCTAGALGHGERVWMTAKIPDSFEVGPDTVDEYLLLTMGHNGRTAITIRPTTIRVVCQNTFTAALRQGGRKYVVHHTRSMRRQLYDVEEALHDIQQRFAANRQVFNSMLARQMRTGDMEAYMANVFPLPKDQEKNKRDLRIALEDRKAAKGFAEHGAGNNSPKVRGTLWAAFNGITDYVDHARGSAWTSEKRLNSVWFGQGAQIKARAFEIAAAMVSQ